MKVVTHAFAGLFVPLINVDVLGPETASRLRHKLFASVASELSAAPSSPCRDLTGASHGSRPPSAPAEDAGRRRIVAGLGVFQGPDPSEKSSPFPQPFRNQPVR